MIKHLFKMIWNKKKQNALLISEMFISFLVLFAVFTLLVFNYQNYKKPMGFDYENVWLISYTNAVKTNNTDSLNLFYESLRQTIKSLPQIKELSFVNDNVPFSNNTNQTGFTINKKHINHVNWHLVEDSYVAVLHLTMTEGRWFDKSDLVTKNRPVIINTGLAHRLFGDGPAVGKLLGSDDDKNKKTIIGVVQDLKDKGDYTKAGDAMYERADTASFRMFGRMLVKVNANTDASFESKLYKTLSNSMKNSNVEIEHLEEKRKIINYFSLVPMVILLIVAGFLVINVSLGLFGVLWYNINKRRGEIGLRRAVGASGQSVTWQLIGEAMVVATFSLIAGSFFAIQFPLLNVFDLSSNTYFIALAFSVVFIYLLVLVCALYPGRQAAAIYPAVALHED